MKSIRKFIRWIADIEWTEVVAKTIVGAGVMALLAVIVGCIIYDCTTHETATDFVPAVKYGEVDSGVTLFMTEDGNLYAFHAHFAEQNGSRFLVEVRLNDPKDPTDDELIELWSVPSVSYDIDWAE